MCLLSKPGQPKGSGAKTSSAKQGTTQLTHKTYINVVTLLLIMRLICYINLPLHAEMHGTVVTVIFTSYVPMIFSLAGIILEILSYNFVLL